MTKGSSKHSSLNRGLKNEILKLRKKRKSYNEICHILKCSKAVVSYHCTRHKKNDIGLGGRRLSKKEIRELNVFYKTHTIEESVKKFRISRSGVIKYTENKRIKLTKEQRRIKNYERVRSRGQEIKQRAVKYKGGKCEKCGYDDCVWAFDFHHRNPKHKDFRIGSAQMKSWEKIKKELNKCMLVCSNCHRKIHYELFLKKLYKDTGN